ncbi:MAG: YHS domain-containing protein [Firmicutes bacterium]|nr:YHS domain-containing protein [Bacillota bacterium]
MNSEHYISPKKWLVIAAVSLAIIALGVYLLAGAFRTQPSSAEVIVRQTQPQSPAGVSTQPPAIPEKDPVCGMEVDPVNAPFKMEYSGHMFYFDRKECFDAFQKNPINYLPVKIKVKITVPSSPQTGTPSAAPSAEPTATKTKSPQVSPGETPIEETPIEEVPIEETPIEETPINQ